MYEYPGFHISLVVYNNIDPVTMLVIQSLLSLAGILVASKNIKQDVGEIG